MDPDRPRIPPDSAFSQAGAEDVTRALHNALPQGWGFILMVAPKIGPGVVGDAIVMQSFDDTAQLKVLVDNAVKVVAEMGERTWPKVSRPIL